jgi:hypothetical protein
MFWLTTRQLFADAQDTLLPEMEELIIVVAGAAATAAAAWAAAAWAAAAWAAAAGRAGAGLTAALAWATPPSIIDNAASPVRAILRTWLLYVLRHVKQRAIRWF